MKKFIVLVLTAIFSFSLFADPSCKVDEYGSVIPNTYFFKGFNFNSYDPAKGTDLTTIVQNEARYIRDDQNKNGRNRKYAVIGHSQGGLRVLAYANMVEQLAKTDSSYKKAYENLGGIVTVSGIDQGLLALKGGFAAINSKFDEDIEILYNGIKAGIELDLLLSLINECELTLTEDVFLIALNKVINLHTKEGIKDFIVSYYIPDKYGAYLKPALSGESENSLPEIRDMIPDSDFIKKNVAETKSVVNVVRDVINDREVINITYKKVKILGLTIKIPVITISWELAYKRYVSNISDLKVNDNIPILYIVGLRNNTLSLLDPYIEKYEEKDIRTMSKVMNVALAGCSAFQTSNSLSIFGLLNGAPKKAIQCGKAAAWFGDIDGEIAELLNSTEHDGLVAKESQYFPAAYHSNVIICDGKGYLEENLLNHAEIDPSKNPKIRQEIENNFKWLVTD